MTTSIVNGGAVIDGAGGGGASLPTTPALALLDAANQGEVVLLAPSTGVGTSLPIEDVVSTGIGILTESPAAAGDFVVGDGAGATQLASAAAAAVRSVIGIVSPSSGTYAARPASPAVGDIYTVSSGARTGSAYRCDVAGTWRLASVAPPTGTSPQALFDGERLEALPVGGFVLSWPDEISGPAGAIVPVTALSTQQTRVAGSSLPQVALAAGAGGGMLAPWQQPTGASARAIAFIVSDITNPGTWGTLWGGGAWSGSSVLTVWGWNVSFRLFAGSLSAGAEIVTPSPSGSTPAVVLVQYDGTTLTTFFNGTAGGTATTTLATTAGPLVIGARPDNYGERLAFRVSAVLLFASTLDSTQRTALQTWASARHGAPAP